MNANELSWMLQRFTDGTPGVRHAQTVSTDGMHLAATADMSRLQCDQFAAIASGMAALNDSAGEAFGFQPSVRQVLEFPDGWILITRISASANLAVVCEPSADLGLIGYEMTELAHKAGAVLSPEVIAGIQNMVAPSPI